ncbi:immunoglobulin-like domain-containing protein [Psychroserpens sp.]|uniref:immunoglobulin-like domain-containing protein n=1 Tax=Psychroserpens sp. TaxID=2020870 RepID=UPI001B26BAF7|nr:immunoglobulin-like domain-containing protein [Psychroserpens sp.]MBO6605451.1 DUF5011 domain-containing protein [Psychroserpens sp.]MBO6653740.1 DUF5011 domain-containing protein [Psychroserpens sp.]MBO6682061.1 DUF5011 domain-containing protein [Psychroserpens sp.]MBO6748825.1 DUF5011 domain-containing protein [Psychroserpens sp.]MBO6915344.1 DUF5011 domain-containing protein [Psychroserpens sp.]
MKIRLGALLLLLLSANFALSQGRTLWQTQNIDRTKQVKVSKRDLPKTHTFTLNIDGLKQLLNNAPQRNAMYNVTSGLILEFPNDQGKFEAFKIAEAPVLNPELQERYPEIRSYVGQGIDDPTAIIRFSVSPLGFQSMRLSATMPTTFIEAYTQDLTQYTVFKRADKLSYTGDFECSMTESLNETLDNGSGSVAYRNADDGILRTYRLVVSATGEYTQYHGGTKALALAAINQTMTRVNGLFETDFNVTMTLIGNTDDVIYTNPGNDPYGNTTSGYNSQLQNTLTSVIGEANYDIGHLFANLQNNGNAGCIGCVCVNGQKGSGWTSLTIPEGDPFDVDYVAHEMGHQFGGNHTFTFSNEGTGVQMEPGSGSTIMGYAGITGPTDVQQNSDPYFHAVSIQQITDYIKTTSCQTNTATGNSVPTVDAGSNYTIPRGTPFVLDGTASDADPGDVLTYCWEQFNNGSPANTNPSVNNTSGPAFRSFNPTTDSKRYFPRLQTIKTGATSWQWEAVPNVSRNMTFRLTVRDNRAGGATNNSDDMTVSVTANAGPFVLNSPNTNVTWNAGTLQSVTWNVAGTTGNGVNAANVDIFLSTDGGDTYPITLATGVPNDGSHDIVVPNNQGNQNRIMVRGSNNIFFDISNTNFTIGAPVVCNATVPTGLAASNVTDSQATLSWDAVPGATYDLRYREVGAPSWTTIAVTGISETVTGLSPLTDYEAQVRSKCTGGSNSAYSASVNFTTPDVQLNYCGSQSTNVNDEYISRVQLNTIDNSSGAQFYSDFTNISTTLTKDSQYTITITPTWTGTVYNESYAVWIDYNRDGDFTDAGEQVFTQGNTTATSVSGSFTIPTSAVENSTRMRVSMKYNALPGPCETFTYGEVEDYTVIIEGNAPDTEAPVITLNGASTIDLNVGETYTELGATATDNVDGNLTSSIVIGGDVVNTAVAGTYLVTYNVSDAAGNAATEVVRTVNVIPDTTPPVITLIGAATINLQQGDAFTDPGATASDNIDGDLTSSIVVGGDTVNTNIVGSYVITYNVSDSAGNAAVQVTRTVNVNPDTTPPVITLIGASVINLNVGEAYNELGATATDNLDGDISANIVITGSVNTAVAGTYFVNYNVSDSAGNAATQVTRTVNVLADTTPPVITLNGASSINLNVGDTYTEQGATALDNLDGDITGSIVIGGDTVNTNAAGVYVVTYNVSDAAGNAATEVTRTVTVIADTTPPVITLIGASTINLLVGDTYVEQGATATDNIDGDISSSIVIGGSVNTNAAGSYQVTYDVSDAAGNAATQVVRTVNVSEPTSGCSGGINSFPYSEGFENTLGGWTQSTNDDINWTVDANGTPSNGTGPSSATQGSFYIYVEASGNGTGYPNKRAILNSPCFDLSGLTQATFSFKYHQFGSSNMGSIDLEISDDDGASWVSIWNSTGNKGNQWLTANVSLDAYVGGGVQLRFNRLTGSTWQADIAIDDVSLIDGEVVVNGCSGGITSYPYSEGFENTLGGWTQSTSDDINWTVDANGTPSNGTGPSSAIQGSFYIYVEASGNGTGYPNRQAIINSPCFDLTNATSANFSFNYHQFGSNNMGTIDLEASNDDGASWVSIWNSSGNLGNSWQSANVDLSSYTGGSVQLRFNRITGGTWQADIAIDNINLSVGTAKGETSREVVIEEKKDIIVYPNPVRGNVLNIKSPFSRVTYEIYNSVGQLVGRGEVKNNKIDISRLDSALYQIQFTSEEGTMIKRFMKQ